MENAKLVEDVKKNCSLCKTYKSFHPKQSVQAQQTVLKELNKLVEGYNSEYNSLRRENAESEQILQAKTNKTIVYTQ